MEQELQELAFIQDTISEFIRVRYLIVAGATVLLYDTVLTSAREVSETWHSREPSIGRIGYLVNRYFTLGFAIYYVRQLFSSDSVVNHDFCTKLVAIAPGLDIISTALGNALILYELVILWDARGSMVYLMASGYILAYCSIGIFSGLGLANIREHVTILPIVPLCVFKMDPLIYGAWISAAVLDVYSFALLLFNALSRPRTVSQKLVKLLVGDGIVYFLTVLGLRMLGVITIAASSANFSAYAIVGFEASVGAAVISRLYLDLQERKSQHVWKVRNSGVDSEYGEETELQVRGENLALRD